MIDRLVPCAVVREDEGDVNRLMSGVQVEIPVFRCMVGDFVCASVLIELGTRERRVSEHCGCRAGFVDSQDSCPCQGCWLNTENKCQPTASGGDNI